MSAVDTGSLLAPVEDETVFWGCEEPDCLREAKWLGLFHCTCLVAMCEGHKERYDAAVKRISERNGGLVTTLCENHGRNLVLAHLVVSWSQF